MTAITTRAGKGSPLTNAEVDANFTNLNADKEAIANKGVANGYAGLDATGKVPASQLPSYVDDVLEFANLAGFPGTGEAGKIYVAIDTNKTYRWSGSAYIYITSGAVDSVAGKTGVVTLVKGDVGLGNVDNTSDANKPVSTAQQTSLDLKANAASPSTTGTLTHSGNIILSGSGNRITGDFSNATVANRAMFQSSTVNGNTTIGVLPNGTGQYSYARLFNSSDAVNNSNAAFGVTPTEVQVVSEKYGTGTYLPMSFYTGGANRMLIDANGNVGIGQDPSSWYGNPARFVAANNQNAASVFGFGNSTVGANAKVQFRLIGGSANSFLDQVLGDNNGSPSFLFSYGTAVQYTAFSLGGAERLRIAASGAFGLGGANYGTAGQVLTSGGAGVAPSWTSPAGLPAGAVAHFAMSTAPSGWLKANGAAVSRTAYAALFTAIGTTYGVGDGSTTFNLPDLRGEFVRGWDDARGVDSGRALGSAQAGQNLSHNHGGASGAAGSHSHTATGMASNQYLTGVGFQVVSAGSANGVNPTTSSVGNHQHSISSDGGTEARPRNIALLACIKF